MGIDDAVAVRSGRLVVVPYDPGWPAAFAQVQEAIGHTLAGIPIEVHHVGSTAVPGLCAKPKIDVHVVLTSQGDLDQAIERLGRTERDYHGNPYHQGMWTFTTRRPFSPAHRIYVCCPGTPAHLKRVAFRDYLRAHPEVAATYGALKRELVVASGGDSDVYTEGKSDFVADVVARAMASQPRRRSKA